MRKWNELRTFLIEGILSTEAGMLDEQEKALRLVLKEMDKLDIKYHKKSN